MSDIMICGNRFPRPLCVGTDVAPIGRPSCEIESGLVPGPGRVHALYTMYVPMMFRAHHLRTYYFLVALAFYATKVSAAEKQDLQTIHPVRNAAILECVSEDWAVWRTSELIEETRSDRGQAFHHRFYRQRLTEPAARFAFGSVGSRIGDPAAIRKSMAITPDGTIVVRDGYTVEWQHRNGSTDVSQRVEDMIRQVYADGILVQAGTSVLTGPAQARFIPFKQNRLDFENEVEVPPTGIKSFQYGEPVRHENVFAWLTSDRVHFFDLGSGRQSQILLVDFFNSRILRVTAFDGATIVVGRRFAFDAESGTLLANPTGSDHYSGLLAARNRIGYSIQGGWLLAIDLVTSKRAPVRLAEVSQELLAESSKGITVYTPRGWKLVPWLLSLPANDIE